MLLDDFVLKCSGIRRPFFVATVVGSFKVNSGVNLHLSLFGPLYCIGLFHLNSSINKSLYVVTLRFRLPCEVIIACARI